MMVTCLVGLGFLTMDSSIRVVQMMGLLNMLHSINICFWGTNTFSVGISMPMTPLATMVPSLRQVLDSLPILNLGAYWQLSPDPSQCPLPISPGWWMAQSWSPQLQSREKRSSKLLRTSGKDFRDVRFQTVPCD